MRVEVVLTRLAPQFYRVEVVGLSIASTHGHDVGEALQEALDTAALYLDCKEPEMIEFDVRWEGGTPYIGADEAQD